MFGESKSISSSCVRININANGNGTVNGRCAGIFKIIRVRLDYS